MTQSKPCCDYAAIREFTKHFNELMLKDIYSVYRTLNILKEDCSNRNGHLKNYFSFVVLEITFAHIDSEYTPFSSSAIICFSKLLQ